MKECTKIVEHKIMKPEPCCDCENENENEEGNYSYSNSIDEQHQQHHHQQSKINREHVPISSNTLPGADVDVDAGESESCDNNVGVNKSRPTGSTTMMMIDCPNASTKQFNTAAAATTTMTHRLPSPSETSATASSINDASNNFNANAAEVRPILVGYAFGPKKMNTMSLVMAEASQAVSTVVTHLKLNQGRMNNSSKKRYAPYNSKNSTAMLEGEEPTKKQKIKDFTCATTNDEYSMPTIMTDNDSIVTTTTSASITNMSMNPISTDTGTSNMNNNSYSSNNHIVRTVSRGFLSSSSSISSYANSSIAQSNSYTEDSKLSSSSSAASSPQPVSLHPPTASTIATATTTNTATTNFSKTSKNNNKFKPLPGKYIQIPQHYQPMRVSFVPLDLNSPLEEQHGGKFDAILHKMTEDILCKSQIHNYHHHHHHQELYKHDASSSSPSPPTTTLTNAATATTATTATINYGEQQEALNRIDKLIKYKQDHPACCLVDHPNNVEVVMSRSDIAQRLMNCLRNVTTKSGIKVNTPRYLVLNHENDQNWHRHHNLSSTSTSSSSTTATTTTTDTTDTTSMAQATISDINKRIDEAPFNYPFIVKPLTAAGTAESHKMGILLDRHGISNIHTPCLLQEYLNHNGRLYKVYVLGNLVWVFPRPSLPNLPLGEFIHDDDDDDDENGGNLNRGGTGSGNDSSSRACEKGDGSSSPQSSGPHYVEFDSQRPYPTLSDFGVKHNNNMNYEIKGNFSSASSRNLEKEEKDINKKLLTCEEIRPVADCIRHAFGLELFGFDILVTTKDRSAEKEMLVVDVNYFPSYKEVSNFSQILAQYLAQCGIEGRVRSFDSER